MQSHIARRAVVKSAAVMGAVATGIGLVPAAAAAASRPGEQDAPTKQPTSLNGWTIEKEANHVSTVWTRPIAGTGLSLDIRIGDAEAILVHVIRRFHYEIQELRQLDLAGWRAISGLRKDLPESNLASGTAVLIRPGAGAKGSLFPLEELALRDILADCEGTVRWGGDDTEVNESLFYIAYGPHDQRVRLLADRLRLWSATPGAGAGTMVDFLAPARRERADRLARSQRRT